jgi:hypothetical protein
MNTVHSVRPARSTVFPDIKNSLLCIAIFRLREYYGEADQMSGNPPKRWAITDILARWTIDRRLKLNWACHVPAIEHLLRLL